MKKIRALFAMLMVLVMLVSLTAVAFAASGDKVTSTLDFTKLTPGEDMAAVAAAVKALGAEDCSNLVVGDCYNPLLTGKGYAGEGYYVQKISAGEGKVFAEAPVLTLNYRLTTADPMGYIKVEGSVDGVNYYPFAELNQSTGDAWTAEAKTSTTVVLNGGEGSAAVWVKVSIQHWGGPDAACVDVSTITASVKGGSGASEPAVPTVPENAVINSVDFSTITAIAPGSGASLNAEATKTEMQALGLTIPADSAAWMLTDCFTFMITPVDGYADCSYIQTLDAGNGKVLEADAVLDLSYALAVVGDPGWIFVEVSTDGETYEEVWANEDGQGAEWDASAFATDKITLTGTAGASKIWVKVTANRHGGYTAGAVTKSVVTGLVKSASAPVDPKPSTPVTPDIPLVDGPSHVIVAGETLGSIALNYYGSISKYQALFEVNRNVLSNPNMIIAGQTIVLPDVLDGTPRMVPQATAEGETLYTVQPGDTLGEIAVALYGSFAKYQAIFERNIDRVEDVNSIYVGQVLVLPAK